MNKRDIGILDRGMALGATIAFCVGSVISDVSRAGALLVLAIITFGVYWILKFKSRKENECDKR